MKSQALPPQDPRDDLEQFEQRLLIRRMQWTMAIVGTVFVVIAVLVVQVYVEKERADAALIEAQRQTDRAELERKRALAAERMARQAEKVALEAAQRAEAVKSDAGSQK